MSSSDEYYDSEEEEEELDCMPLDPELEGETLLEVDSEDESLLVNDEGGLKPIDTSGILDFFGIGDQEGTNTKENEFEEGKQIDEGKLQERVFDKVLDMVEDFGFGLLGATPNPGEALFEKIGEGAPSVALEGEDEDVVPTPVENDDEGEEDLTPLVDEGDKSGNDSS